MKALLIGMLGIAIAGGVVIGGYQLGWWLREEAVNRGAEIREDSFARQTALQAEVLDLYRDITNIDVQLMAADGEAAPVIRAQRIAIKDRLCDAYARMNPDFAISQSAAAFAARECLR